MPRGSITAPDKMWWRPLRLLEHSTCFSSFFRASKRFKWIAQARLAVRRRRSGRRPGARRLSVLDLPRNLSVAAHLHLGIAKGHEA